MYHLSFSVGDMAPPSLGLRPLNSPYLVKEVLALLTGLYLKDFKKISQVRKTKSPPYDELYER
jgi:hypothetical protein